MCDGWGWGYTGMPGWGTASWILMALFWIAVIALIVWAVARLPQGNRGRHSQVESPQEILDRRFASGEIDVAAYEQARASRRSATGPMTSRPRGRRVPLVVLVAAVLALLSSVLWAGVTPAGSGNTSTPTWEQNDSIPGMPGIGVDGELAYLTQMVAHHQEAVDAARQLERSGRAEMRTLGASIVTTQTAELTTMNAWLAAWYPGRSTAVAYQAMMRDLSTLSGDALDEAFLRDMIPHHMAAVMTSQQLLVHGRIEHQDVAGFARTVRDAQHAEIIQMQRYLTDWFGGGWRMDSSAPCVSGRR